MKQILRILIALIFIASGFVKAVDVIGFSFKMEEYFAPGVFNIPFLEKQAVLLAIFMVVLELVLGFLLLIKVRLKVTISSLIVMCVFFGFLTFYSAYFNVVTDCGCFGDALKFTPWQSFWKDIVLLIGLIILCFLYKNELNEPEEKSNLKKLASLLAFAVMVFTIYWGVAHEPLIDFRHYKIGTDLNAEKAKIEKDPSEYKTFYSMKNEKSGEVLNVNQDDYVSDKKYWGEGSPWKIEEGKTTSKIVKKGYESEISKFKPETSDGISLTEEILKAPKAVLIFSYHPDKIDAVLLAKTEAKVKSQKNTFVAGVSTNPNTFKTINNAMMDGTAIKTIARSNPFVLTLQNGKIVDKKSAEDYLKQ